MNEPIRDTGWFKSSFSSADSDNCVEVRIVGTVVGVRDSKNVDGPTIQINVGGWHRFLTSFLDVDELQSKIKQASAEPKIA